MKGRKPKPSYLRVLNGNAGKRPVNADEPKPVGNLEDHPPPEWLNDAQKERWRYAMNAAPPGMLKRLDQSVLAVWVVAAQMHADASEKVSRLGSMLKSKEGVPYQNPYMAIMNKQAVLMMKAASELGFSPSSRSRVKVEPPPPGRGDPFADLKQITDE